MAAATTSRPEPDCILRLPAVKARTGLGTTSIYGQMARHEFPSSIPLGGGKVGWSENEVHAWIAARKEMREQAA